MIAALRQVLLVFSKHRLWDEGVELIGSWSFYLYQKHLGVEAYPFRTQDIDFLLPYPFRGKQKVNLIQELEEIGFQHDSRPDGSVYLRSAEFSIDFIIPDKGSGMERAPAISALGLRPVPLRFVDILLEHPIFLEEDGMRIVVPDPAAFCLHKLLIAMRRPRIEKRVKDMEQALRVVPILNDDSLRKVYASFPGSWKKKLFESLERVSEYAPLLQEQADSLKVTLQKIDSAKT